MSRETKTIEEIKCDVCRKVTTENFGQICTRHSRSQDVVDEFQVYLRGKIGYGGEIVDLCRDCARQQLTLALKSLEPPPVMRKG